MIANTHCGECQHAYKDEGEYHCDLDAKDFALCPNVSDMEYPDYYPPDEVDSCESMCEYANEDCSRGFCVRTHEHDCHE
jgi:hypothetical protein